MRSRERKFEVAVFNEKVRRLVQQGERHRDLNDSWGDTQYMTVAAQDVEEARRKAVARYPESRGFVIEQVVEIHDD